MWEVGHDLKSFSHRVLSHHSVTQRSSTSQGINFALNEQPYTCILNRLLLWTASLHSAATVMILPALVQAIRHAANKLLKVTVLLPWMRRPSYNDSVSTSSLSTFVACAWLRQAELAKWLASAWQALGKHLASAWQAGGKQPPFCGKRLFCDVGGE